MAVRGERFALSSRSLALSSPRGMRMRAAYYERNGPAREVLKLGEFEAPQPGRGEVRIKLAASGINPSDVKARSGATRKIAYPRVIPHSDGAGEIDAVGDGVSSARIGERVWVWNAQWQRAFGTCAEYVDAAVRSSGPPAGQHKLRGGSLSGYSSDDGIPRRRRGGRGPWRHALDRGRSRRRRPLCRAIRQSGRCDRHRHHQFSR